VHGYTRSAGMSSLHFVSVLAITNYFLSLNLLSSYRDIFVRSIHYCHF